MNLPPRVFMDPRIAARLPETPDEAQESIGSDVELVVYVLEDWHKARLREASDQGQEFVVQIQSIMEQVGEVRSEHLVALTTFGRMFERKGPDWVPLDLPDLET